MKREESFSNMSKMMDYSPSIMSSDDDVSLGFNTTNPDDVNENEMSTRTPSSIERSEYVDPVVAEKKQKAVFYSRTIVVAVLLVAVTIMSVTMYLLVTKNEKDDFENQVRKLLCIGLSVCMCHLNASRINV